jgi:hypothetical protein
MSKCSDPHSGKLEVFTYRLSSWFHVLLSCCSTSLLMFYGYFVASVAYSWYESAGFQFVKIKIVS